MTYEDKLFALIAHAEEIQTAARNFETAAGTVLSGLQEVFKDVVRDEARTIITNATKRASEGLQEASREVQTATKLLRRTWVVGLGSLAVVTLVLILAFIGSNALLKGRGADLDELKVKVAQERATLDELRSKTWSLELMKYDDGSRGIILPKGVRIDRTGDVKDGRAAVVIRP